VACVRSGISGRAIGLLIGGRAGAERRAANPGHGAGRRRGPPPFSILDLEIGGGEALTLPISIWLASSLAELRSSDAADFYLVGEFFGGAVRRPPLAAAGRRAAFGCGWRSGFWHRPSATAP
jgi:hypothetical protein